MFEFNAKALALTICSSLALAGCGGGGDTAFCGYDEFGDPVFCQTTPTLPPPPVPVASSSSFAVTQGLTNVASQQYTFNVSAADSYGNVFTIAYSSMPGPAGTFGGVPANTANVTQILYENGAMVDTLNTINYYAASPYQFLGSSENAPGGSEVVNSWQAPPATATVGQAFPLMVSTLYHDSSNSVTDGTLTETLGLSPDTATTALLCQNDTVQLTQSGIDDRLVGGSSANCFRIDTNGNVLGMQITTPINGVPLLFY